MSSELARIPDRVLPAPAPGDLPEPVALRRMIGPSIRLSLALLVLSATLNGFVMFLYSGLLLWLNVGHLRGPLRIVALVGALGFFGYFSVLTLTDQLARIG